MARQSWLTGRPALAAAAVLLLTGTFLLMLAIGADDLDRQVLLALYAKDQAFLLAAAKFFTFLGNWWTLVPVTVAAAAWLAWRGDRAAAIVLLVASFSGRGLVILEKRALARLRPEEHLRLVDVDYMSFPSGHSANSLIVYVGIAVLAVTPGPARKAAIGAALIVSLLVGLSRPMLGVHWPSDVIGGWAFGALWLMLVIWVARSLTPAGEMTQVTR